MFYYAILTDVEGTHSYCGCLLFYEPVVSKKTRPGSVKRTTSGTENQVTTTENVEEEQSEMTYYVPKCLCLVTRQKHLDTIKVSNFPCFVIAVECYNGSGCLQYSFKIKSFVLCKIFVIQPSLLF